MSRLGRTEDTNLRNILVFRIGQLGDTVVALPAMWAVRRHFPQAHFTLLSDKHPGKTYVLAAELLKGAGIFDRFESYIVEGSRSALMLRAGRMLRLLFRLRRQRYDALVYLAPSRRTVAQVARDRRFFRLAGICRFFGMGGFRALPAKEQGKPLPETPSEADLLLERLAADGIPVPRPGKGRLDLGLGKVENIEVERWLRAQNADDQGRPWIGVGPGSKMAAKRWPEDRFRAVISTLIEDYGVWPIVFGGPEDSEAAERLVRAWGCGFKAAGKLSPRVAAAALKRCRLYVGNDTGTMHLAAAAGVPCVAVFSAREHPGLWYPYGVPCVVLRTQIACEGCGLIECVEHRNACLDSITVSAVINSCRRFLGRVHSGTAALHRTLP